MREKVLITSELKKGLNIIAAIPLILGILGFIILPSPGFFLIFIIPGALISALIYWELNKTELTVTDKRVFGSAVFNSKVTLPVDSISSVGTSFLWGIDVGTSSGRIHFKFIENKEAVYHTLCNLLIERQQ